MRQLVWLVVLGALVVLTASCGGDGGNGRLLPPEERQPAPQVAGETVAGEQLALADLEGPVVVNFWASWCGPCAEEMPELVRLQRYYADRGVSFVGVNVRDQRGEARRFAQQFDAPYPSWFDPPGQIAAEFGGIAPSALPSTLVLDAQHRVAARFVGAVTYARVQQVLQPLLAQTGGASRDAAQADPP